MPKPPDLADAALTSALQAHYGIAAAALTFLPIGNDSESAVYRLEAADGTLYFLKLRTRAGFSLPSLAVPRFLQDSGVPHILAPLPTRSGSVFADVDGYAMSLYPFIDSRTARDAGLNEADWRDLGAALKQIHSAPLPPDLARIVRAEDFVPSRRGVITDLEPVLAARAFSHPLHRALADLWRSKFEVITAVVTRCDALARRMHAAALPRVLCHADLHTWNVLVDANRQMWIVDWDETVLAPKERDLMFVIRGFTDGLVKPHEITAFLDGYGNPEIDPQALTYYRYAWAVQEIGAYAELVFLRPELGEGSQRAALDSFKGLFEPGQIIAIALET